MQDLSEIRDMIAVTSAAIDQTQAQLDDARRRFPNPDPSFTKVLEESQFRIDAQRVTLDNLRVIQSLLEVI